MTGAGLQWLTYEKAANWLGVTPKTIRRWVVDGILVSRKGKRPSIGADSVVAVLSRGGAVMVIRQRRWNRPPPPRLPQETADEGWLTPRQAGQRLGMSAEGVRIRARAGGLEARVVQRRGGRRVWVSQRSVEKLEEEGTS